MDTVMDVSVNFILDGDLSPYRAFVQEHCRPPLTVPPGTVLSGPATPCRHLYYLLSGMVKVYTSNLNGYVRLLGYHSADTFFVLDSIRGTDRPIVTIESVTPLQVIPVTLEELQQMYGDSADFAMAMTLYVGDVLRLMCLDAESQSICDVTTRLANFFCLYMKSREYQRNAFIPMSQDSLASAVNASRVQVARICSRLQNQRLIRVQRRHVSVLNEAGLRLLSQYQ